VLSPVAAVVSMLAAFIVLAIMRALAMRQIGGQTGDVCGATQVLTELAMLAVYAAMIG
jgi:adenosylcobinamide-GDP ribazoletransferase